MKVIPGMIRRIGVMCCIMLASKIQAQSLTENFDDNSLAAGWTGSASYTLTETSQQLSVGANVPASTWTAFSYTFSSLDLSSAPYVKIDLRCAFAATVRVDLEDINGNATNGNATVISLNVTGNNLYVTHSLDFTGRFIKSWPTAGTVDATQITKIVFFVNPGGSSAFNRTVFMDNLLIGTATGIQPPPGGIRLNQLGFAPGTHKHAVAVSAAAGPFYLTSSDKQDTVYTGTLGASNYWSMSGENVRQADFSDFDSIGSYYVLVPGIGYSHPFSIDPHVHLPVTRAAIKAFYYQRATMAISAPYADSWPRAKGHNDNSVLIHNSAANPYNRPTGSTISSPRGWYDAGDYNKYIVNSGISTFTVLAMYEHYSACSDTLVINIPEKNNTLPDVLDEALWNVRWMLTMQDPFDGGVYHKLTNANFDGTVMPSAATSARYVVKKSTAATLDFAAVMAQSARIFSRYPTELPGLADSCINAAFKAWKWARKNPNVAYVQSTMSSPAINTGEYGDGNYSDEFLWAATEIYVTTKIDSFYVMIGTYGAGLSIPGWSNVRALSHMSLIHNRKQLTNVADTTLIKTRFLTLATGLRDRIPTSPYGITMSTGDFNWGSSGTAANHGMILLQAFQLTKDSTYLDAALTALDYLLGRNATNYCFVTGFGNVRAMNPHHRICGADGVTAPVPGLLIGGPNTDDQNDCGSGSYPSTVFKAKAYVDSYCSYSTNEIAINWNAPLAYLTLGIEAVSNASPSNPLTFTALTPTNIIVMNDTLNIATGISAGLVRVDGLIQIYPNPAADVCQLQLPDGESWEITVLSSEGVKVKEIKLNASWANLDVSQLSQGIYFIQARSNKHYGTHKLVVE